MIARLWWKDARQFWPIWGFLLAAAAGVQWVVLRYGGPEVRSGLLPVLAVGWACLYALAVGASAFAGEREGGTLALLDALPVARWVLWEGKVSFALVSTLGLALALVGVAALGTERWDAGRYGDAPEAALVASALLLEALGWGLLWSARSGSALNAAVWSIVCTAVAWTLAGLWAAGQSVTGNAAGGVVPMVSALLLVAGLTTAVSALVIVRPSWARAARTRRAWVRPRWRLQSPIVVESDKAETDVGAGKDDRSLRRPWLPEARALAWQSAREGAGTWRVLLLVGLLVPGALLLLNNQLDPTFTLLLNVVVGLTAGVSVFNVENRARGQRFLAHHGARPGLVWLVKVTVWAVGLAMIWLPIVSIWQSLTNDRPAMSSGSGAFMALAGGLDCAAVGLLCGMAIRRGITAVVLALVVTLALMVPQATLLTLGMLWPSWLLAVPLGLLGVSWAWSGDWLFERPAPGRWVRLGLLLTGAFVLLGSAYAGGRAWGVPEVAPLVSPQGWTFGSAEEAENAADLYREAGRKLAVPRPDGALVRRAIADGFDPKDAFTADVLGANREALELTRRAAAKGRCRFAPPEQASLFRPAVLPPVTDLALLVALDARERQARGDLAGAWDDVVVLFRMSRHAAEGGAIRQALSAMEIEKQALGLALDWATDPNQTAKSLRDALASYRALPGPIPAAEVLMAEARDTEWALDRPDDLLDALLTNPTAAPVAEAATRPPGAAPPRRPAVSPWEAAWFRFMTTPWERERARRVLRLLFTALIREAEADPSRRPHNPATGARWLGLIRSRPGALPAVTPAGEEVADGIASTPLVHFFVPPGQAYEDAADRLEVARRALPQVLALQVWRLEHGGKYPDRLEEVVPGLLPALPKDPYAEGPFRYARASGQPLPPLARAVPTPYEPGHAELKLAQGNRLLYSVGPDTRDDGGQVTFGDSLRYGLASDIVFPLPPEPGQDVGSGRDVDHDRGAEVESPDAGVEVAPR
jgi:hypothetical protein